MTAVMSLYFMLCWLLLCVDFGAVGLLVWLVTWVSSCGLWITYWLCLVVWTCGFDDDVIVVGLIAVIFNCVCVVLLWFICTINSVGHWLFGLWVFTGD